jgi:hypothetical protein
MNIQMQKTRIEKSRIVVAVGLQKKDGSTDIYLGRNAQVRRVIF